MIIEPKMEYHFRKMYDLNQLLSDMGGVTKVLITAFGIFLYPLSEYNYNRALSRQLYYASTKNEDLFHPCHDDKKAKKNKLVKWNEKSKIPPSYDHEMKDNLKRHRLMFLRSIDEIVLFFHQIFEPILCRSFCCSQKKRNKLLLLYKKSKKKIHSEFNIIKMVRSINVMKSFLKNSFLTPEIKFGCMHSDKRIIFLDDSQDTSSEDKAHDHSSCDE